MNSNKKALLGKVGIAGIALYQMFLRDVFEFTPVTLYTFSSMCVWYVMMVFLKRNLYISFTKELVLLIAFHIYMLFAGYAGAPNVGWSLYYWKNYTLDYIIVLTIIALINEEEDCELTMKIFTLGALAMVGMMIFMPSMRHGVNRIRLAENMNTNYTGLIFCFGLFMAMYTKILGKKRNFLILGLAALVMYAIFMTGSRKSLVVCVIFVAAYMMFLFQNRNIATRVFYIVVLGLIIYIGGKYMFEAYNMFNISERMSSSFSSDTDLTRINMYKTAWELFKKKPFFGYGYQGYAMMVEGVYSHSTISELLTAGGVCGTLIYLSAFAMAVKNTWKTKVLAKAKGLKGEIVYKLNMLLVAWVVIGILFFVIITFYGTLNLLYVSILMCCGCDLKRKVEKMTNTTVSDNCEVLENHE